jgi:hypothetical protein
VALEIEGSSPSTHPQLVQVAYFPDNAFSILLHLTSIFNLPPFSLQYLVIVFFFMPTFPDNFAFSIFQWLTISEEM